MYLVSVIQSLWLMFWSPGVWHPHSMAEKVKFLERDNNSEVETEEY